MISNPAVRWVDGQDQQYTYEGGNTLYNFQPADCGLSNYRECNLLIWADSPAQAVAEVVKMFQWFIESEHLTTIKSNCAETNHYRDHKLSKVKEWLSQSEKIKVIQVPKNQMLKTAWASNDTFI